MLSRRLTLATLAAILLLGLFLRLYRLDLGMELPYLAHTDEPTQYNPAVRILKTGDLNPHFFRYPSLPIYLYTAVLGAGYLAGRLLGAFSSSADVQQIHTLQMSVGVVGTPSLLLLGRATSALLGALTVGLAYVQTRALTRRAFPARRTGPPGRALPALLAALLLALSLSHVRLSHYMTVDVMATTFAVACVAACTLALTRKSARLLWIAALCGGLATSCKYNYAFLALPVALACWLDPEAQWTDRIRRTVASGALFLLAFLLTSPFVLLDAPAAWKDIRAELQHYARGHLGVTGSSATFYLGYLWETNPFYLLLGLPGLALALARRQGPARRARRAALPMVAFVLLYFWLIARQAVHFDRNVLPVLVLLIAAAGVAVDALLDGLHRLVERQRTSPDAPHNALAPVSGAGVLPAWATAALLLVPLLPSLWMLPGILQAPRPSGKAQAQAWFDETLHTATGQRYLSKLGSQSLRVLGEAYTVYLDPDEVDVAYVDTVTTVERGGRAISGPEDLAALGYDVVILGSAMYHRFYESPDAYAAQVQVYDAFFEEMAQALAFEQEDDPLAFRAEGMRVYTFFLTEQARQFLAEASE